MNPYAAKKKATAVSPEAPDELPTGSIADVLAWVGTDKDRANEAIDAEKVGAKRASLLKTLKSIVK